MRFQGENCTLSFSLYFDKERVVLTGTLWPRRPAVFAARHELPYLRFTNQFTEHEIVSLQQWLKAGLPGSYQLTGPFRYISRQVTEEGEFVRIDLELNTEHTPPWWNWDDKLPLKIKLEVRPNEFTYLTNALTRDHWSANLSW